MSKLMCIANRIRGSHRFFVTESEWYVGRWEWHDRGTRYAYAVPKLSMKQQLYYPIAYLRFMYFESADWI